MELTNREIYRQVNLLQEMLTCGLDVWTWYYDGEGALLSTNCPDAVLDAIFAKSGCKAYMLEQASSSSAPVVLSAKLGMLWGAAFHKKQSHVENIFVIGPVFNNSLSEETIREVSAQDNIPDDWRPIFQNLIQRIPVLSSVTFFQYVLMLHYCATGEHLSRGALHFQKGPEESVSGKSHGRDRMRTWNAEQALLDNVRKGNLNFQPQLERAGLLSNGVRISADMPVTQARLSEVTFVTICTRAAIEGGMSPDAAYTLGDSYIQRLTDCESLTEMQTIGHSMYEDFIFRVHALKSARALSTEIQSCRDYIDMHPTEPLTLDDLASRVWYSPSYLSRKFKEETGETISAYIRSVRLDNAKDMLRYSEKTISQIAEELHFCSASHFAELFRKREGILPQAYRKQTRKL